MHSHHAAVGNSLNYETKCLANDRANFTQVLNYVFMTFPRRIKFIINYEILLFIGQSELASCGRIKNSFPQNFDIAMESY